MHHATLKGNNMADSALLIFIVFLIAANGTSLVWLWLKPRDAYSFLIMGLNAVVIGVLVTGLSLQNSSVAIFHL
jgi:drug/metabolite transporter superfamily protein YnfA